MQSWEIREKFLGFFARNGHERVPSSSLVPGNDPTLLFTNAGMVQFKDVFLGLDIRPYKRATTSQKCMRAGGKHNDLEAVGPSIRHHTFFEMLGNFSFGDYFKREAIGFAWELLTREFGLPEEHLWATIYRDDDEAYQLWREVTGIPPERIVRLGEKDNFWSMGDTGPCGPCSEIVLDRGVEHGCGRPDCDPSCDCDRWLELWNLVFMQYDQDANGERWPLPRPSIDTGMGLERITAVLQGVESNYETDLFRPVMTHIRELLHDSEEQYREKIVSYRVVADHSRAVTFLICDGVQPGNEGRAYVLRRILRRAVSHGMRLGFNEPFLANICDVVIDLMALSYPDLLGRRDFILKTVATEEEGFRRTVAAGLGRFDALVEAVKSSGQTVLPGRKVFELYDTYGFPVDLAEELAQEHGVTIDAAGLAEAMEEQRSASRAAAQFAGPELAGELGEIRVEHPTDFVGYHTLSVKSPIVAILREGERLAEAGSGEEVDVVLATTPFYPEGGGQVGDTGVLEVDETTVRVVNTMEPLPDVIVHKARVETGILRQQDSVLARVDAERRLDTARNHTATHILHKVLRDLLGTHVKQAGSLVSPDRLRFDFTHLAPLTREQLLQVERRVNEIIRSDLLVTASVLPYDEAVAEGAMALFGEKYGAEVRMVSIDSYSRELCGGTHLSNTGEIGLFLISSESSVGTGVRRIEALTGRGAEAYTRSALDLVTELSRTLKTREERLPEVIQDLQERLQEKEREIGRLQSKLASGEVDSIMQHVTAVNGVRVASARVSAPSRDLLREMGDRVRDRLQSGVVVLGTAIDGKPSLVAMVTKDLAGKRLSAGQIVKQVAARVGGGGGGRPDLAEAGGRDASKLDEALASVPEIVAGLLSH